jgi:hypothetical protein
MTDAAKSPVSRIMRGTDGKEYVVTLAGAGIFVREKGRRQTLTPLPPSAAYHVAAKMDAAAQGHPVPGPRRRRR